MPSHRVLVGQSTSSIAALHGVSVESLVLANPQKATATATVDGRLVGVFSALVEGEILRLPASRPSLPPIAAQLRSPRLPRFFRRLAPVRPPDATPSPELAADYMPSVGPKGPVGLLILYGASFTATDSSYVRQLPGGSFWKYQENVWQGWLLDVSPDGHVFARFPRPSSAESSTSATFVTRPGPGAPLFDLPPGDEIPPAYAPLVSQQFVPLSLPFGATVSTSVGKKTYSPGDLLPSAYFASYVVDPAARLKSRVIAVLKLDTQIGPRFFPAGSVLWASPEFLAAPGADACLPGRSVDASGDCI